VKFAFARASFPVLCHNANVNRSHTPSPHPDFGTGLRARLEQLRQQPAAEVRHLPVRRVTPEAPVLELRRVVAA
jgi:hypothetical protein